MSKQLSYCLLVLYIVCLKEVISKLIILDDYDHVMYLDESEKYQLFWTVDHGNSIVSFATVVNTTGWVGFGIAKGLSGKMGGADIAIGFVLPNGTGYLVDRYATGEKLPLRDEEQDFILTRSKELNGQTVLEFNRSIEACDMKDNNINVGTTKLIFAYGDRDPNPNDDATIEFHKANRGSRSVNLLDFVKHFKTSNSTASEGYIDIKLNKVKIPKKDTTYWCQIVKIPQNDLGGKRHVTEMRPVIQSGHEGIIHHFLIHHCGKLLNDSHIGLSFECKRPNMLPEQMASRCRGSTIFAAWAIGGDAIRTPDVAGIPVGEDGDMYFLIEVHFDNPQNREGLIDSSGMRLMFTSNLRKYDAGVIATGIKFDQDHIIPPRQKSWQNYGYCYPFCTEGINNQDNNGTVNIFAAMLHMHTAGRKISTSIVKNGIELRRVLKNDNYDFNLQETVLLPKEIPLHAGESILTYCQYNTESRNQPTFGGESTREEMCYAFLHYYPKVNLIICSSDNAIVGEQFNAKYSQRNNEGEYNWTGIPWTNEMTYELRTLTERRVQTGFCTSNRNGSFAYHERQEVKPMITSPLRPAISRCQQASSSTNTYATSTDLMTLVWFNIVILISAYYY